MANSLLTGFSGLTTHQRMIEVVGNNLANLNTDGFKSQRTSFADVYYETLKGGSGGTPGVIGGSNPAQVGNGSKLATVSRNFSQGGLESTGSQLDFAIDGEGFFVVNSDEGPSYTRAGTFGVDSQGYLVDKSTGYLVQRFGTAGEINSQGTGFQSPGATSIRIPLGTNVPETATTVANFRGNLDPGAATAEKRTLITATPLTVGGVPAVGTDLLNNLDFITSAYAVGDSIVLSGQDQQANPFSASIPVNASSTLQDLVDAINAELPGATVQIDASGHLNIEADAPGNSLLSVALTDATANTGSADFAAAGFEVNQSGSDGASVPAGITIFDEQGNAHVVGLTLRRDADRIWRLEANLNPAEGTLLDSTVEGITFTESGAFQSAGVSGTGDVNLVFQFAASTTPQTIRLNFGAPGTFLGTTSVGGQSSLSADQDGTSTGTLVSVSVDESGLIEGAATNGRRIPIAQLAIARFRNPGGLEAQGNNLFRETSSTGTVELGAARSGGRGSVRGGTLEQSNVDIATEFTRLIIAQRGFAANSRTITVTSQILEELTNLIR